MILLDTNVVSEGMRSHPHASVRQWMNAQPDQELFICTPVLAELRYGVELLATGARRSHFERVVRKVEDAFANRTLPVDRLAAHEYGRIVAQRDRRGRPIGTMDALIAAVARVHQAVIATRDLAGFDGLGLELVNPFDVSIEP
jgi:toxin FitB